MLLEVTLKLDPFKTVSQRLTLTSMVDFLAALGGFYTAIDLLLLIIGQFFSSRMLLASVANTFYSRKLPKEEVIMKKAEMKIKLKKRRKFKEDLIRKQGIKTFTHVSNRDTLRS